MELVKDIAAVLGLVLTAASVLALVSKNMRNALSRLIRKHSKANEVEDDIIKTKTMLEAHIQDYETFKQNVRSHDEIMLEYVKTSCRNQIKDIFYRYKETKVLPLYEKKTLMYLEQLYVGALDCNSFAKFMLQEMADWEVDLEEARVEEEA